MLPPILTIAGSDNSAGAGAQADLKTISALGGYALTAMTCVVAEVPGRVSAIQAMEPAIVAEQIRLSFAAFPVAAVKTGMLYSREIIGAVCDTLDECMGKGGRRVPLVVDPVMVATSGDALLQQDAVALYRERLFPMATVVTPNLDEVRTLLGRAVTSVEEFSAPFVDGVSTHGTGCTYSAAIAAGLGKGLALREAVAEAKGFVTRAVGQFIRWEDSGRRTDALNHFAS